jgi:hypothetical protein
MVENALGLQHVDLYTPTGIVSFELNYVQSSLQSTESDIPPLIAPTLACKGGGGGIARYAIDNCIMTLLLL